ncbi:NAD(P)/FAD-dependent oxidoreductase [Bradyrhizobium diazoefficiens]|uniref:NAD(P)-binding domain-containing protein n=1 Tax=Bradyrhizobium diazoefficiens TaxID=1355477 RepID=UPI00190AF8FD|nr:NAD(P)/FAD-dependent oxidoreductase [Bradyrhizobium diazoefficiens]QQO16275.1 NAD(P)/FAD-dependent oxidoreductase [Bradyrhizobium diazoefficiens]
MSVSQLTKRVRRELSYLEYPAREWTIPRFRDGSPVLDVLIVGGGQSGLGIAFGLRLERITNFRIIDRRRRGFEGPWRSFARMKQLRTPKEVTGIDFGIPSLTVRAWYEEKFGKRAWDRIDTLHQEVWRSYLDWYRDVLALPVENDVELVLIEPVDDIFLALLRRSDGIERVHAKKIVLATGFEGSGSWRAPRSLVTHLSADLYAHSADVIDFRKLAGKRIGILGAGASAFDNAALALEAGAARVDLCFRRSEMPRVNPLTWMNFAGMLGHFGELSDLDRWRFMRHILEELPVPPTQDAYWRCRSFENFHWHSECGWSVVEQAGGVARARSTDRSFDFDFIIFANGVETDLAARPELVLFCEEIALWQDRFTPPRGEESESLARYPYLGKAFEFTERHCGAAPFLKGLYNFTFGAMLSHGISGAAITGMKYGLRRLVSGIAQQLFREEAAAYYRDLLSYETPELRTLDSAFVWLSQLGSEAVNGDGLVSQFDQHQVATLGGSLQRSMPQQSSLSAKSIRLGRKKRTRRAAQLKKKKRR